MLTSKTWDRGTEWELMGKTRGTYRKLQIALVLSVLLCGKTMNLCAGKKKKTTASRTGAKSPPLWLRLVTQMQKRAILDSENRNFKKMY